MGNVVDCIDKSLGCLEKTRDVLCKKDSKMVLLVRRTLPERQRILCSLYQEEIVFSFYACVRDVWEFLQI